MTTSVQYATLTELKSWLGITDAVDDTVLTKVLNTACSQIDRRTGHFFGQTDAGTVRYYTAGRPERLLVDDLVSVSAIATDWDGDGTYEDTWAATDYALLPANAATDAQPYDTVQVARFGDYLFPVGVTSGVKITGVWGWPYVPDEVGQACILRATRLFKRRETPLGMAGSEEMGLVNIARWDSDFTEMLDMLRHLVFA